MIGSSQRGRKRGKRQGVTHTHTLLRPVGCGLWAVGCGVEECKRSEGGARERSHVPPIPHLEALVPPSTRISPTFSFPFLLSSSLYLFNYFTSIICHVLTGAAPCGFGFFLVYFHFLLEFNFGPNKIRKVRSAVKNTTAASACK